MSLWECAECLTHYSVGAPFCPQCGTYSYREVGGEMPKISKAEGPTSVSDPGLPPHFEAEAEPEDRAEPAEDSNVPSTAPPFTVAIDEQAESRIAEEGEQAEQTEQVDTEEAAEPASTVSTEYTRPTRRRR